MFSFDVEAIPIAVEGLFNGECDFGQELGVLHRVVFQFEGGVGSSDTWTEWEGADPVIVENESFCGRHSLFVSLYLHYLHQ